MKSEKVIDKTKYFKYMIENHKQEGLLTSTSFVEIFVNNINEKLGLRDCSGVSWKGDDKGWWIQLGNYQEYLINDYECKLFNKSADAHVAIFIDGELESYMKKQFGLKYKVSRKKYFNSQEKEIIK